jgi:hypothetical protein
LSVAEKTVIDTDWELEVGATENDETVGAVVSETEGGAVAVTVVVALLPAETLPAASLAQAYSVFAPALAKV